MFQIFCGGPGTDQTSPKPFQTGPKLAQTGQKPVQMLPSQFQTGSYNPGYMFSFIVRSTKNVLEISKPGLWLVR